MDLGRSIYDHESFRELVAQSNSRIDYFTVVDLLLDLPT